MKSSQTWIREKYRNENIVNEYNQTRFEHLQGKLNHFMEIEFVNEALKKHHIKKVLEIAPGTGRIAKGIEVDKYLGVDSSQAMLNELRKINKNDFEFRKGDAFDLSLQKENEECVISFRLIRHFELKNRIKLYKEINQVLKKDGVLIFDALNRRRGWIGKFHDILHDFFLNILRNKEIVYDEYFKKEDLVKEMEDNGFKVLTMDAVNPYYAWHSPITRLKLKFLEKIMLPKAIESNRKNRNSKKCYSWVVAARKN